jgi:hypothetical protein
MNASSNVRNSSTPAASSTLRPRNRRLISGLDEGDETTVDPGTATSTRIASPVPSPFDSRAASPIPALHLPRKASRNDAQRSRGTGSLGRASARATKKTGSESPTLSDLWGNSWTTIQGLASELLSGDAAADAQGKPGSVRRTLRRSHHPRSSTSAPPPSHWGPAIPTSQPAAGDIGAGTREEQLAALRAQKRLDLLTAQDSSHADTLGKYKRRLSDDHESMSAPPGDNEDRDALVYVHHVLKNDTLAGITIRYNCPADVVRKANRMWPNDTVQMRPIIILPVEACAVKGKPLPETEALDLLTSESDALSAGQAEEVATSNTLPTANGDTTHRNSTNSASTNASRGLTHSNTVSSAETEPPWHHDSWVLLPGCTKPTEIARLSRRALGYFPPTRRKSNCYSDLDTPSTSFDLTRTGTNDLLGMSPGRQPPPQRPARTRRPSNATNGYFPSYLAGPGGVGTLDRKVNVPGPAQDSLNKLFAKHLPDVAPPRHQQSLLTPEMPLYTDDPTPVASGAASPNAGKNINLENVGGAIESWMRRMATQTKAAMTPIERQKPARVSVGTPAKGVGGIGDLIEMTDEFEIGGDEEAEEDRGRQGSAIYVGQPSASSASYFDGAVARERSAKSGSKSRKND